MHRLSMMLAVSALLVFAGVADADAQEKRRGSSSSDRRGVAAPPSRGPTTHKASRGSVGFHRSGQSAPAARGTRGTTTRVPAVRSGTQVGRVGGHAPRVTVRTGTTSVRSYHPTDRYRASSGSLRVHRPVVVRHGSYPRNVRVYSYPRYGTRITHLPATRQLVVYRGHNYYVSGGIYYRPTYGGHYTVCRPPIGVRLTYLPQGFVSVSIGNRPYYRYENTYYVEEYVNDEPTYVVVAPPEDAIIDYLPADAQEVYFQGRPYYIDIYEEIAYEAVLIDGRTWYRPTDLDVDVDFEDDGIEIEIEED